MKVYHQLGHNFVWNVDSIQQDNIGDGVIISPVNVEADKVADRIPPEIRANSFFDPQFYRPQDSKTKLSTYEFFPGNVTNQFSTAAFDEHAYEVATKCLRYQIGLGLAYLTVPTRYFDDIPPDMYDQLTQLFVEPFFSAYNDIAPDTGLLLTGIVKQSQLLDDNLRNDALNWLTGFPSACGIYLIFDNNFNQKQIKHPGYLANAMRFVRALRQNGLEVHVGYTGLEGVLYSIADPSSVTIGSYENLRSFAIQRLETAEPGVRQSPRPRIYSGRLLQSFSDIDLPAFRELVPNWEDCFDPSPYKHYLLDPHSTLSFQRSEVYKHYFTLLYTQVQDLPAITDRSECVRQWVLAALEGFDMISNCGVYLGPESDSSHLTAWMNAIAMYEANPDF